MSLTCICFPQSSLYRVHLNKQLLVDKPLPNKKKNGISLFDYCGTYIINEYHEDSLRESHMIEKSNGSIEQYNNK